MSRLHLSVLAGAALLALAACDDAAAPEGVPGDLTVRAYVDRDASGDFTEDADLAIEGLVVTATPAGDADGETRQATTDASGRATFDDLPPGSYQLSYASGSAPAGAVLTSNPTPTVAISFQGTPSAQPEFRYVFQPAILTGQIYRDDNGNGTFDLGTDTPGPGLKVWLRADTGSATVPGARIDSTISDDTGGYRFTRLAPGSYFVEYEVSGAIDYGEFGMQRITLAPSATATSIARYTGSLILTIAEARSLPSGSRVAVVGNITTPPGRFTSSNGTNSEIWLQDASGGIAVFSVPTARAAELALGQRVQVVGTTGNNGGQLQIVNPGLTVTALTGSTVIAPRTITGAQLASRAFDGQLGRIPGVVVDSIGTTTSTSFTVFGKDAAGDVVAIRVIGAVIDATTGDTTVRNTGLTRANFTAGGRYDITGQLTQFISGPAAARDTLEQIKPRFTTDVVAAPVTPPPTGPARIIINELIANPAVVSDNLGEYIELYNAGGTAQDLTGWMIVDLNGSTGAINGADTIGTSTATPTPLVIQPGQYLVLGANADAATNGGVTVHYKYNQNEIQLNNSGTQPLVLLNAAGQTVDSVSYTSPTATAPGVARGVVDANAENADINGANWVDQTTVYATGTSSTGATLTDRGTPGARNDGAVTSAPAPARVIINEFIANPQVVGDNVGEYIELRNVGGTEQQLQGWIIADAANNTDTIDVSLVIPAGGYVLLGVSADRAVNGNIPVDFAYKAAVSLNQGGDQIRLRDANNVTVDSVVFTGTHAAPGVAWGVINPEVENTNVADGNWAAQTSVYNTGTNTTTGATITDAGTPRARNDGATGAIRASAGMSAPATLRRAKAPFGSSISR